MPLVTTCIGSYPKPHYVPRIAWMHENVEVGEVEAGDLSPEERRAAFDRATREVVAEQAAIGIDIPTDGEIRRANYIRYHCSHLDGFELDTLTECTMRNGAWTAEMPTFTGKVAAREPFLVRDWEVAQAATNRPVKITVPGPLTIADSTANVFYANRRSWCADLAEATWRSDAWRRRGAATSRSTSRSSRACRTRRSTSGSKISSAASTASPAA